jgi:dTDP-4-amino-4,6-dideoxygalactose transaminase
MEKPQRKVPFVDLSTQFREHAQEWMGAAEAVAESGRFIGGPEVASFEAEFARFSGCKFGVGVASGTDALRLALLALGIGPGDEVVTVSHTFVASSDAIVHAGARPVFVDIDPDTYTMDPIQLKDALGPKVKAVIPVHLYGQSADMAGIMELCKKRGIPVLEDAAQAHGAAFRDQRCGSVGAAGCFSFYPAKNLGAWGDGGMVTTNDEDLADKVRLLREYGRTTDKYRHALVGWNSRLDALQAAVMRLKLRHLDSWNNARRRIAARYRRRLDGVPGLTLPREGKGRRHIYHLYVVRARGRESLQKHLERRGIETGIHYPIPVHLQPSYQRVHFKAGPLRTTERVAKEILSLPMYPELPPASVDFVAQQVAQWAKSHAAR